MTNEELIAEKKRQIEGLKQEIAELEAPRSIAKLVKNKMLYASKAISISKTGNEKVIKIRPYHALSGQSPWLHIKGLCMDLVRERHDLHMHERLYIRDLTPTEVITCAQMADEMIEVWNKYIRKLYIYEKEETNGAAT